MPSKVPEKHAAKKKGKSIQERRAEKRAKKSGTGSSGLRLGSERPTGPQSTNPHPTPGG